MSTDANRRLAATLTGVSQSSKLLVVTFFQDSNCIVSELNNLTFLRAKAATAFSAS